MNVDVCGEAPRRLPDIECQLPDGHDGSHVSYADGTMYSWGETRG